MLVKCAAGLLHPWHAAAACVAQTTADDNSSHKHMQQSSLAATYMAAASGERGLFLKCVCIGRFGPVGALHVCRNDAMELDHCVFELL